MQGIFSLLNFFPYLEPPYHLIGWIGWLTLGTLLLWAIWRCWEDVQFRDRQQKRFTWLLILSLPLTSLFFGVRLLDKNTILMPGMPVEPNSPALLFFSAIPWVLAGGIFGTGPAVILAAFSGLLKALWGTHNVFTPLEIAGLALLFSIAVRQRYRTPFFGFLRHPMGAAIIIGVAYSPIFIITAFFATKGTLAARLDYSLTQTWLVMIARGGELVIASLIGEFLFINKKEYWGSRGKLIPSPAETNLQIRLMYRTAPLALILFITLMISVWLVAGRAARQMLENRLSSTAYIAGESLPYFIETGQMLILDLADDELLSLPYEQVFGKLAAKINDIPYFQQLFLIDIDGEVVVNYPESEFENYILTQEEQAGIQLALNGVTFQTYIIPPLKGEKSARITYLAVIQDSRGQNNGVLIGRTDFNSNPFTQPAINALEAMSEVQGEGIILDDKNRILYHTIPSLVMMDFIGILPQDNILYDETSSTGTRQLVYYHPVIGAPWAILLIVPAEQVQQLALDISIPLLAILLVLLAATFVSIRIGLRVVSESLYYLAQEATSIAKGRMDSSLQFQGVDEVGRFGRAFEKMRLSLKARLEELNRLLLVSQNVAANLEVEKAIRPVLEVAIVDDICLARVVLVGEVTFDPHSAKRFSYGYGHSAELYAYLDEHIFSLMQHHDVLSIPDTRRVHFLNFPDGVSHPGALIALALGHENNYYGALWVAFEEPHDISEEYVRFLRTLAGQAAMAAANAQLYATADIGRQRLEAVLASTPDPVLVIDEKMNLLLTNPAALQVPGLISDSKTSRLIKDVILAPDLLDLIISSIDVKQHVREIILPNGRVYYSSVSPIIAEGRVVGKVCNLRDITDYKELDALKSEFVSTVSHDLRSPLAMMRGYATMLQMLGDLNEQQKGYVKKIISGVDNMDRMVNNLLDLRRIETGIGLQIQKVSAVDVINLVFKTLQPQATQKKIQLEQKIQFEKSHQQAIIIEADPDLLKQALYNLVENAIKFTPVGGKVGVRLVVHYPTFVYEVYDTGIGIAPLDLQYVFEKFSRIGRSETDRQRGTGIGLAIVKSVAERHGGRVWVESQLGKGSTFSLELPVGQSGGQERQG